MSYKTLLVDVHQGLATVTINRPEQLNALSSAVFADFHAFTESVRHDPAVRVIVITGSGDKAFAAGADIKEFAALTPTSAISRTTDGMRVYDNLRRLPQPVIASINGFALGGGMLLAMACDIRVAADTAQFGYPEIRLGIFPGTGGTVLLSRLVGPALARSICLLGERFSADRAHALGLVTHLVSKDGLKAETKRLADTLLGYSPVALRELKGVLDSAMEDDFETARVAETSAYARVFASQDRQEGVAAFVEKRPPRFTGR